MNAPAPPSPATEPRLSPDRHDGVLAALLGALVYTEALEKRLGVGAAGGTVLDDNDPAVLASLGAIALGLRLRRWMETATGGAAGAATERRDEPLPSGDLLR